MTRREIHRAIRWFQRNVGLTGWTIAVLPGLRDPGNAMGECVTDVPYHMARIWINREAHDDSAAGGECHTLFHELLHCFFDECLIQAEGEPVEWAINQLASILLQQYRTDTA